MLQCGTAGKFAASTGVLLRCAPPLSENTIKPLIRLEHLPRALVLAGALLAAGCAVQPNNRGGVMIGVDTAELFGKQLGGFRLADGTPGSLRHDPSTGAFSVKIGSYRVVPLPNAVGARIAMVAQVEEAAAAGASHIEFMLHSSEFMPAGSPTFPDTGSVERLYADLEALFERASALFTGATLAEFRHAYEPAPRVAVQAEAIPAGGNVVIDGLRS